MVAMLTAKFKIKSSTYCSHSFCVFSVCVCVCVSVCVCVCVCVLLRIAIIFVHWFHPLVILMHTHTILCKVRNESLCVM